MRLFEMKPNYSIAEIVKTLTIEVDKPAEGDADHIHFDFVVMIAKLPEGAYAAQVYRLETLEVKSIGGEMSHDEIMVKDVFLINDLARFMSEDEVIKHLVKRLDELFGAAGSIRHTA